MPTVATLLSTLAVNTHLPPYGDLPGYINIPQTIAAINYLGVRLLRDSCASTASIPIWQQVMNATGAKFIAYLPTGSPKAVQDSFGLWPQLYRAGLVMFYEGPNEEDVPYAVSAGNSITAAKDYHIHTVLPWTKSVAKPLVNMSFGAGWSPTNNWEGDYDKVGDMSPYCDYANAHTYPNIGQRTSATIKRLNGLANIAAPGKPVFTTEIGWNAKQGWTETQTAKNVLQAAIAGVVLNNPLMCFYALYDDASGAFGMFNTDGTPRQSAVALHNLISTLKASGGSGAAEPVYKYAAAPTDCAVTLTGMTSAWIALWNEADAPRNATVTFEQAHPLSLYYPLTGKSVVPTASTVLTVPISDEVVLIKVG